MKCKYFVSNQCFYGTKIEPYYPSEKDIDDYCNNINFCDCFISNAPDKFKKKQL
jgi:hypothetical protein